MDETRKAEIRALLAKLEALEPEVCGFDYGGFGYGVWVECSRHEANNKKDSGEAIDKARQDVDTLRAAPGLVRELLAEVARLERENALLKQMMTE